MPAKVACWLVVFPFVGEDRGQWVHTWCKTIEEAKENAQRIERPERFDFKRMVVIDATGWKVLP